MQWLASFVFPLKEGGTKPMIKVYKGCKGASQGTTDQAVIAAWARQYPNANIGIATGLRTGLCVVEIRPDGFQTVEDMKRTGHAFPRTVEAITPSGGKQIFLKYRVPVYSMTLGRGVRLASRYSYAVAAPSYREAKKASYRWESNLMESIADAPDWLISRASARIADAIARKRAERAARRAA